MVEFSGIITWTPGLTHVTRDSRDAKIHISSDTKWFNSPLGVAELQRDEAVGKPLFSCPSLSAWISSSAIRPNSWEERTDDSVILCVVCLSWGNLIPILLKYRAYAVHTCIWEAFKSAQKIILHASQKRLLCTASFRINMAHYRCWRFSWGSENNQVGQ